MGAMQQIARASLSHRFYLLCSVFSSFNFSCVVSFKNRIETLASSAMFRSNLRAADDAVRQIITYYWWSWLRAHFKSTFFFCSIDRLIACLPFVQNFPESIPSESSV